MDKANRPMPGMPGDVPRELVDRDVRIAVGVGQPGIAAHCPPLVGQQAPVAVAVEPTYQSLGVAPHLGGDKGRPAELVWLNPLFAVDHPGWRRARRRFDLGRQLCVRRSAARCYDQSRAQPQDRR
jgi:hypothetical protein